MCLPELRRIRTGVPCFVQHALEEAVRKNRKLTTLIDELKGELAEARRQKKEYAAVSKENERLKETLAAIETQVGRPLRNIDVIHYAIMRGGALTCRSLGSLEVTRTSVHCCRKMDGGLEKWV
jgi:hypothetical protein